DSEIESLLASSVQDIVTGTDEPLAGDGMQELNQNLSFERADVEPTAALGGAAGADLDPAGSAPVPGAAGDPASPAPARSAQTASAVGAAVPVPGAAPLNAAPPSAVKPEPPKEYVFPTVDLLAKPKSVKPGSTKQQLMETANKLQEVLSTFGVNVTVTDISCGPAVTRYEVQPEMGVKVSKIVGLADDIKLNLAAPDVRIEAPIPGKAAVGIEVPNKENVAVPFRELVGSEDFKKSKSKVSVALGKDIGGNIQIADIAKMPHVLIAGATGSGKSVCINSIIMSILYKATPEEVKLIMIDPKVVELSVYNGIPHLLIPVVTDPKKASGALNWAVAEMTERYEKFAEANVREINGYNEKIASIEVPEGQQRPKPMEQIVIIVDELADLMMVASGEVEEAICRLAQLARAAGIHLIIATQRPSVNVITGLIKANMPSRIAFAVTSGIDSRTILDMNGAEKLLGKGDMLYYPQGIPKPIRVQGAFVSDKEVGDVVAFIKEQNGATVYSEAIQQKVESAQSSANVVSIMDADEDDDGRDAYFSEAAHVIVDKEKASIGMLQRYLKIGFNRAARIMDQLEEAGVVGPEEGTKPRKVTMTPEELEAFLAENE
ncbi:MAG: DNA translocase FtsK, partial [Clostridiales bacterium]|nr:DNA translocase FtsK [Clostridiales bacterium]